MKTIKNISFFTSDECEIDIDRTEEFLAKLPTVAYIELYHKMQTRLYGYPNFGGCCGTLEEKKPDIKIDVDYSEVDEARKKIDELGEKLKEVNSLISKLTDGKVSVYADFSAMQEAMNKYQQEMGNSPFEL